MKETETSEDINERFEKYNHAWQDMMIQIWRDRIFLAAHGRKLGFVDDIQGTLNMMSERFESEHQFVMPPYAIYWMMGVGNGYKKGPENGGNLQILDPIYRIEHNMNKPRLRSKKVDNLKTSGKPRERHMQPIKSWSYSQQVMMEAMFGMLQEKFIGSITEEFVNDIELKL